MQIMYPCPHILSPKPWGINNDTFSLQSSCYSYLNKLTLSRYTTAETYYGALVTIWCQKFILNSFFSFKDVFTYHTSVYVSLQPLRLFGQSSNGALIKLFIQIIPVLWVYSKLKGVKILKVVQPYEYIFK